MQYIYRIILFLFLSLIINLNAMAIYIENDILIIDSDEDFISRSFLNNSKGQNIYLVSMYKIDRPGKNEKMEPIESGEVMYAPLRMVVDSNKLDYFKVYYQGPKDDKERYYRIALKEIPTTIAKKDFDEENKKNSLTVANISLDTYVVIRPRKMMLQYDYKPSQNELINTGNTFVRVLLHQGCEDKDDPIVFDVLPGETLRHKLLQKSNRNFIINKNRFIQLENQCIDS